MLGVVGVIFTEHALLSLLPRTRALGWGLRLVKGCHEEGTVGKAQGSSVLGMYIYVNTGVCMGRYTQGHGHMYARAWL